MTEQHNLFYLTLFICGGPCKLFLLQKVLYACVRVCVCVCVCVCLYVPAAGVIYLHKHVERASTG